MITEEYVHDNFTKIVIRGQITIALIMPKSLILTGLLSCGLAVMLVNVRRL